MRQPSESALEYRLRVGEAAYQAEIAAQAGQARQPQPSVARPPTPRGQGSSTNPPSAFHTQQQQPRQPPHQQAPRQAPRQETPPPRASSSVGAHHMEHERQARELLGMTAAAERTEEAVRRGMRKVVGRGKVHPDQGGNPVVWKGLQAAASYLCKLYARAAELGASRAAPGTQGAGASAGAAPGSATRGWPAPSAAPRGAPPSPTAAQGRRMPSETEMEYRVRVASQGGIP